MTKHIPQPDTFLVAHGHAWAIHVDPDEVEWLVSAPVDPFTGIPDWAHASPVVLPGMRGIRRVNRLTDALVEADARAGQLINPTLTTQEVVPT